jgi:hypothetical protein
MSKRRQAGEVVVKREFAGFIGERMVIRLEPEDDRDSCCLCDDPDCCEWANCAVLDDARGVRGYCYHVSECQMEDLAL